MVTTFNRYQRNLQYQHLTSLNQDGNFKRNAFPTQLSSLFTRNTRHFTNAIRINLDAVMFIIKRRLHRVAHAGRHMSHPLLTRRPLRIFHHHNKSSTIINTSLNIIPNPQASLQLRRVIRNIRTQVNLTRHNRSTQYFTILTRQRMATVTT